MQPNASSIPNPSRNFFIIPILQSCTKMEHIPMLSLTLKGVLETGKKQQCSLLKLGVRSLLYTIENLVEHNVLEEIIYT